jgi:glutamate synthase (NADPH/NADH) large chain
MHPQRERSSCGIGFVADLEGRPSHDLVRTAIGALRRLRHRGAVDADARTGDGAGILLPLPRRFVGREAERSGIHCDPNGLGLAMMFVPQGSAEQVVRTAVEEACAAEGIAVLAWRKVPVAPEALGRRARTTLPRIEQAFLGSPAGTTSDRPETSAHRARRRAERALRERGAPAPFTFPWRSPRSRPSRPRVGSGARRRPRRWSASAGRSRRGC